MKPWDVWDFDFPFGKHPAIIVSHARRVSQKPDIMIVKCSTSRATRSPIGLEAIVDEADGLDWKTIVDCDVCFLVPKSKLQNYRGSVTIERRRDIRQKIFSSLAEI